MGKADFGSRQRRIRGVELVFDCRTVAIREDGPKELRRKPERLENLADSRLRTVLSGDRHEETIVDQWEAQILARILLKARVVFVSECDERIVRDMHMIPAHSAAEAMEKARELVGRQDYTVAVIPDGVSVIVA